MMPYGITGLERVNWKLVTEVSQLLDPCRLDRWVAQKRRLLPNNQRCITCQKSEDLNLTLTSKFQLNWRSKTRTTACGNGRSQNMSEQTPNKAASTATLRMTTDL